MAKKAMTKPKTAKAPVASRARASETAVRNTAIPKKTASVGAKPAPAITHEMIAMRAFDIARSGTGGDDFHNWVRAEGELRREFGL